MCSSLKSSIFFSTYFVIVERCINCRTDGREGDEVLSGIWGVNYDGIGLIEPNAIFTGACFNV